MSRTFLSIKQSSSTQSAEEKGGKSTNVKLQTNSVLGIRNKRLGRKLQLSYKITKL